MTRLAMLRDDHEEETELGRAEARFTHERASLQTRIVVLEAALACIGCETDMAEVHPELAFVITQRIRAVATQCIDRIDRPADEPASVRRPIVRTRVR